MDTVGKAVNMKGKEELTDDRKEKTINEIETKTLKIENKEDLEDYRTNVLKNESSNKMEVIEGTKEQLITSKNNCDEEQKTYYNSYFESEDILSSLGNDVPKYCPERYYTQKYCNTFPKPGNFDILIRIHTNKVMLVSLAEGHDIIRLQKAIKSVSYNVTAHLDRQNLKLKGKRKKGAQLIEPHSILCYINCTDSSVYPVYAGISGKLVEVNEDILKDPNSLLLESTRRSYIAIIIPKSVEKAEKIEQSLLTKEEYDRALNERQNI